MTNAVEIRTVTRKFGAHRALDNISVTVPEGSLCGLLGRNGAGKTTMMSILSGQDRPTSGTVEVFGEKPFENENVLSKISFVRDNQRYPDNYQLRHVLRIAPAFAPHWSSVLAAELVDGFRIPAKTQVSKYSRGQLSSIAIVLGLASRAPLTLLDEPYLGLDVTARAFFHTMLLRDFTEHPRTVLLSTHLVEESEALFDRVIIVDSGQVRLNCESDDIRSTAYSVTGTVDAVGRFVENRTVLAARAIGTIAAATVQGAADSDSRELAETLGIHLEAASLNDLVSAFGASEKSFLENGVRA